MYGMKQSNPVKQHVMPAHTLRPLAPWAPITIQGSGLTGLCSLRDSLCSSLRVVRRLGNQRAPRPFPGLVWLLHFEIAAPDPASAVVAFA
jgi:hypothetical protein